MFEFLCEIDERLYERYLTLERNIKSASNSFYDAYLDMLEHFIKLAALSENIEFKANDTCGAVLKRADVSAFFLDVLRLDGFIYEKMKDYTLKVNAHKHKGEKKIAVDTIVSYLKVFHAAVSAWCIHKGVEPTAFDSEKIYSRFGIFERENERLKSEVEALRAELEVSALEGKLKDEDIAALRDMHEHSTLERLSLEEQNSVLMQEIIRLKDIKLSSMEEKLNKTIELLLELKPAIHENRIITRIVGGRIGRLIDGNGDVDAWIREAKDSSKD